MRDLIVRWSVRFAVLALAAGVAFSFRLTRDLPASAADAKPDKPTKKNVELCRNLVISSAGGGDLLSIGHAFTRRMRRGPFFLAAREMVIERLDATLPDSYFSDPAPSPVDAAARRVVPPATPTPVDAAARRVATPATPTPPSPVATLKNALQGGEQFKELLPTVAGCAIRGLRISRRTDGANVVPWLFATKANAARGGLRLEDVRSVENGVTNSWSEAFLALEPKLELRHP